MSEIFLMIVSYLAFISSNHIVSFLGAKIMGIILGVFGVNMLIEGIKLAFNL